METLELPVSLQDELNESQKAEPCKFEPMFNYILVKVIDKGADYVGRIMIPQSAQIIRDGAKYAEVLAVGHGHLMPDGKLVPLKVKVGDRVYFAALAGATIRLGRETYQITREEEIFGIIHDNG